MNSYQNSNDQRYIRLQLYRAAYILNVPIPAL
jgi:hypothetical protein